MKIQKKEKRKKQRNQMGSRGKKIWTKDCSVLHIEWHSRHTYKIAYVLYMSRCSYFSVVVILLSSYDYQVKGGGGGGGSGGGGGNGNNNKITTAKEQRWRLTAQELWPNYDRI